MDRLKKSVSMLLIFVVILCSTVTYSDTVYAQGVNVSVSSVQTSVGKEFNVTVTISSDGSIGAYDIKLKYDASVIEAVSGFQGGGGGVIQIFEDIVNKKSVTVNLKFKALTAGNTEISVADNSKIIDYDINDMDISSSGGSITVGAAQSGSSNNNLSSLKINAVKSDGTAVPLTISPEFDRNVLSYNATAEAGVVKLAVTAIPEDKDAVISMGGLPMDPGDNKTTIKVTAPNGDVKRYVIYTKVGAEESTTEEPSENTTAIENKADVNVGGIKYSVKSISEDTALPEGFERREYSYKGNSIFVGAGLAKDLIIMSLTKEDGTESKFFIYDEKNDMFYSMVDIHITNKIYTVIKKEEYENIPNGFKDTEVVIDGNAVEAFNNELLPSFYLIYAMNWDGEEGLYLYDAKEGQMLRYDEKFSQLFGTSVTAAAGENSKLSEEKEKYMYMALILAAVVLVLLIVIIILAAKYSKSKKKNNAAPDKDELSDEDNDNDYNEENDESYDSDHKPEEAENFSDTVEDLKNESYNDSSHMSDISEDEMFSEVSKNLMTSFENADNIADNKDEEMNLKEEELREKELKEEELREEELREEELKEEELKEEELREKELKEKELKEKELKEKEQIRKKVEEILNDSSSSIEKEEMDMVIDNLFDDMQ